MSSNSLPATRPSQDRIPTVRLVVRLLAGDTSVFWDLAVVAALVATATVALHVDVEDSWQLVVWATAAVLVICAAQQLRLLAMQLRHAASELTCCARHSGVPTARRIASEATTRDVSHRCRL